MDIQLTPRESSLINRLNKMREALYQIACDPDVWTRENMIDVAIAAMEEDNHLKKVQDIL